MVLDQVNIFFLFNVYYYHVLEANLENTHLVMGWGRTNNDRGYGDKKSGGAYKNVLQKLVLPHIPIDECRSNSKWRSFHRITEDRQICAGGKIRK